MSKKVTGWYYKLPQTPLQAQMMRMLNYWHHRANAWRDGFQWLVLDIEDMRERLPLSGGGKPSVRSLQRCLAQLRERGILITENHRHPFKNMRGPAIWMRPDYDEIGRQLAERRRPTGGQLAATNIQATVEQKTDEQEISGEPQDILSPLFDEPEDDVQSGELLAKKKPTSQDALAVFENKKTAKDYPVVNKPEAAHRCLRDACVAAGYPVPGSFNKKRGGQLKVMLQRMKEEGVDEFNVGSLIFFIVLKWPEFIGYLKATFGVVAKGTAPNHDALTLYAVEAVGFMQGYTAAKVQAQESNGEYGSSLDEGL